MRRVDRLGLAFAGGELKHGASNLFLGVKRQAADRFEGSFKKLGHEHSLGVQAGDIKRLQKGDHPLPPTRARTTGRAASASAVAAAPMRKVARGPATSHRPPATMLAASMA